MDELTEKEFVLQKNVLPGAKGPYDIPVLIGNGRNFYIFFDADGIFLSVGFFIKLSEFLSLEKGREKEARPSKQSSVPDVLIGPGRRTIFIPTYYA